MVRPAALLMRALIFVHRWLGVVLAALFLLWFASGIVMMYWTFPDVSDRDRLAHAPPLNPADIRIPVDAAWAALSPTDSPGQIRLATFDGRPVYDFGEGAPCDLVFADDGSTPGDVTEPLLDRVAAQWAAQPIALARKQVVTEIDQWTVGGLASSLPLHKYSWPDGQQVYVDPITAGVVQYTTTSSRLWAYLGAIPHWLYFTPIRRHAPEWYSLVVWSSLIGTVSAVIGLVIAVWMYSPRRRYRYAGTPTSVPYRGWKRWHTIAGLLFGVVTTTWVFSGLLSMGPFPVMDTLTALVVPAAAPPGGGSADGASPRGRGGGRRALETALRGDAGLQLSSFAALPADRALSALAPFEVKTLEFTTFASTPIYIARDSRGGTRVLPVGGAPSERLDVDTVMQVARRALGPQLVELTVIDRYDAYYLDRHGERPLPVVRARMDDGVNSRYYIDPGMATIAGTYSSRGWVNRWLYHGLHSLDFPWLYNYRPLWDIVVLALMLGGTALCVTSLVLVWRVLTRKIARRLRWRLSPGEDLVNH